MNPIRRFLALCRGEEKQIKKECSTCTEWKRHPDYDCYGCSRKKILHQENADECEFYSYIYQDILDEEKKERRRKRRRFLTLCRGEIKRREEES